METDRALPPGFWMMSLGVFCSAFGPVLVRLSPVDAASTAFWRLAFCLVPALLLARQVAKQAGGKPGLLPALPARDAGLALLAGLLYAADLVLWNGAILRTTILEATMLVMIYPLLVALISVLLLAQRAGWRLWSGGLICLSGIALMSLHRNGGQSDMTGNVMAVTAAFFYAVSFLITAGLCRRHSSVTITFWQTAGAVIGTLPLALMEQHFLPGPAEDWLFMLGYAALTLIALLAVNRALKTLPAALAAILGYGQPVLATILAALMFGEWPAILALIGGTIIVGGLVLAARDKPKTVPAIA